MTGRALIIISSGEEAREKAMTGIMYAVNAKKNNWLDDVRLMFFGPSEKLILSEDEEIRNSMEAIRKAGLVPTACKAIARNEDIEPKLIKNGVNVEYVGTTISNLIREGYSVLTF
ncbi:DsrE/DsrF-like family protein [Thermoplasmatales archaeon]|nr:DsrE/DsrF-like family protein [Thermoplasmatales archaeon]